MTSAVLLAAVLLQQQHVAPRDVSGPAPGAAALASDTGALRHPNGRVPPVAVAVRAAAGAPRIDGRLDDPLWGAAEPLADFTQRQPLDGQPATERTEVRVAYDDGALYVAARLFDAEPGAVAARLGRRDNEEHSDYVVVSIDAYHDHRTAFHFRVNPLGVKTDGMTSDDDSVPDASWDPVWEVATQRDSLGWTAEFRIPLSQLRFSNAAAQVWGFQVGRYVHRKEELARWAYSSQTDQGYASYFGHLFGIGELPRPARLELLPYAVAREERLATGGAGNPFDDGSRERAGAGLDLSYGPSPSLTVNATVNPDFGQVEADPAVVNLTAFETFFEERRPFFVERADLFAFGGAGQFFYSRRIGREPQGAADDRGGFVDAPANSTILGAAKLSGRAANGWSVGALEAVTAREYATVQDTAGDRFRDPIEPLANYAVVRAKRDFRGGASTVGFIGTAVHRDLDTPGLRFLRSAAYAGGMDVSHRFGRNRYRASGSLGWSLIRGDTAAIRRAQLSSARYYQRPDAGYVHFDSARTTLAGWSGSLAFAKESGNWTYGVSGRAISPGFELNDVGYLTSADVLALDVTVQRRWTSPGRVFRRASVGLESESEWNFGGVRTGTYVVGFLSAQFLNYWSANVSLALQPRSADDGLTRGGPLGVTPAGYNTSYVVRTDGRKPWVVMLDWCYGATEGGGWNRGVLSEIEVRPTPSVSLSASGHFYTERSTRQYLRTQPDALATATFGGQYVFADLEQRNLDVTARLNVTLSPALSLQLYAQPFVFAADFARFKELAAPRSADYVVYGETPGSTLLDSTATAGVYRLDPDGPGPRASFRLPNPDFEARSLRGNAVLRWEYRPGSTLFLVWTNACQAYSGSAAFRLGSDLGHLCQGRSDNVFAVKLNYWMSL